MDNSDKNNIEQTALRLQAAYNQSKLDFEMNEVGLIGLLSEIIVKPEYAGLTQEQLTDGFIETLNATSQEERAVSKEELIGLFDKRLQDIKDKISGQSSETQIPPIPTSVSVETPDFGLGNNVIADPVNGIDQTEIKRNENKEPIAQLSEEEAYQRAVAELAERQKQREAAMVNGASKGFEETQDNAFTEKKLDNPTQNLARKARSETLSTNEKNNFDGETPTLGSGNVVQPNMRVTKAEEVVGVDRSDLPLDDKGRPIETNSDAPDVDVSQTNSNKQEPRVRKNTKRTKRKKSRVGGFIFLLITLVILSGGLTYLVQSGNGEQLIATVFNQNKVEVNYQGKTIKLSSSVSAINGDIANQSKIASGLLPTTDGQIALSTQDIKKITGSSDLQGIVGQAFDFTFSPANSANATQRLTVTGSTNNNSTLITTSLFNSFK